MTSVDAGARAGEVAGNNQVHYVAGDHKFEVTLDGKPTTLSPLEAVCLVLQNRYLAMSDSTAEKTEEMQDQVNQINEANNWLHALKQGQDGNSFQAPSEAKSAGLQQWLTANDIKLDELGSTPSADTLKDLETKFTNHVDQLSSTNDLKMLGLKTSVNKAQEALTAADGVLQELKQLMQTIINNMAR